VSVLYRHNQTIYCFTVACENLFFPVKDVYRVTVTRLEHEVV